MPGKPLAVIFDLDGCLVDSERLAINAIADEVQAMGATQSSFEDIRSRFLGVSMTVICQHFSAQTGDVCAEDFVDRVETRLFALYREQLQQIDGVEELLSALRVRGISLAIATGGSIRRMHETLAAAGLSAWFEGTGFSADQVVHGKPAPDLFELAAREIGVPVEDCIVLEDSPHGVEGALAAGMQAIGFVGGSHLDDMRDSHAELLRSKGAFRVEQDLQGVLDALLHGDGQA